MSEHLSDDDLQSLAAAAEVHALKAALKFTESADPRKAKQLYAKWHAAQGRARVMKSEGMLALAGLIADFIQSEECPHCRRLQTAWMFALAHSLIEGATSDNRAIN